MNLLCLWRRRAPLVCLALIFVFWPASASAHAGVQHGAQDQAHTLVVLGTGSLLLLGALLLARAFFVLAARRPIRGYPTAPLHLAALVAASATLTLGMGAGATMLPPAHGATTALAGQLPTGHTADEGLILGSDHDTESVYAGRLCLASDPVRAYDIVAINIEITLNRYLDHDPAGRMYVLAEELARVRQEETANRTARNKDSGEDNEPAVTQGLQGDAIQPLVLRVNQGECLRINLTNDLDPANQEAVSLHLHGSSLYTTASGEPAIATNPAVMAQPGQTVSYAWWVGEHEPEATHYFHSHGETRKQTNHGLFGALIVEPKGARHLNPTTGAELRSGWDAIIQTPDESDFREFVLLYHEIGTERYRHLNVQGLPVQLVDRFTTSYKPGGRALNYRSEPFMNRIQLQYAREGRSDMSLPYSSYAFGDPATPILRSYLGDPVKQRLVHGGAEVFHVHHVHGGAIRWRRQVDVEPSGFDHGFEKQPPLLPLASERTDSQSVGPSESYDVENECGSGGCQQSVGDYLFHCHVAHHYVSGMWGIWRTYNTLQDETAAQDSLPPLQELPDRQNQMLAAVTSAELLHTTVQWEPPTSRNTTGANTETVDTNVDNPNRAHTQPANSATESTAANSINTTAATTSAATTLATMSVAAETGTDTPGMASNINTAFTITEENLAQWVERQLPPPGIPRGYDASVFDWRKEGHLYLNEAETSEVWPGYASTTPGQRPPLYFDPRTGKLAYPFLRPHLMQRPPFAPNHGPAPYLDPFAPGHDLPPPGANGPPSLCPSGVQSKAFTIHAINLPLTLSERARLVDPVGQLYVLKEDEEAVRAQRDRQTPLAIRANASEDCVDVLFKSELKDSGENHLFSKASLHIHFVQFDILASDGVNTGFNYEQTLRPFTVEGETLQTDVPAGDTLLSLSSAERFQPGILLGIGMDETDTFEVRRIQAIEDNTVILDEPLRHAHARGEIVSVEFLRHRWYPDVQFGTAYFHDHVSALTSWRRGLFGALIAEPPGSTYHNPQTGAEVRSGPIVDVHTPNKVSVDVSGSFRELVLFVQDDNRLTRVGDSSGSAFNLRVEPLAARAGSPEQLFSSAVHGDPETPLLESYLGDPLVIRGLVAASNDVHTLHVDGHWFRLEPFSATSPPINTVHMGISERYDLMIPAAGGPQRMPGDYLYYNGRAYKLREGNWGLIRVHAGDADGQKQPAALSLQKLPGRETTPTAATAICPPAAPVKTFAVAAMAAPLPMLAGQKGHIYLLEQDKAATLAGTRPVEPLVLHVNVGDCVQIQLTNELEQGAVSFHVDLMAADPQHGLGVEAGHNAPQAVAPGQSTTYTYFAHPEIGETVAMVRDWGNVLVNPGLGLYGAIVVGPTGATYTHPVTGADMAAAASWRVDVHPPDAPSYRDFALFFQEEDAIIGTAVMPYVEHVSGVVGLNYAASSLLARLAKQKTSGALFANAAQSDLVTPLLKAYAGDAIRIRVLAPVNEQAHVFTLEGHRWPLEPGRPHSTLLSAIQVGALEAITVVPVQGAGGSAALPGDYLYGDHREPYREAGLWGLLRVYAPDAKDKPLLPLPDAARALVPGKP